MGLYHIKTEKRNFLILAPTPKIANEAVDKILKKEKK